MPRTATIDDRLADLHLFANLGRRRVQHLTRLMTAVTRPAGTSLIVQGAAGRECMIIVDGRARVVRDGRVVGTVGPGDVIGEIAALHGGPRTATVTTETDITVEVLSRQELDAALWGCPELARRIRACAAARLEALTARSA